MHKKRNYLDNNLKLQHTNLVNKLNLNLSNFLLIMYYPKLYM